MNILDNMDFDWPIKLPGIHCETVSKQACSRAITLPYVQYMKYRWILFLDEKHFGRNERIYVAVHRTLRTGAEEKGKEQVMNHR